MTDYSKVQGERWLEFAAAVKEICFWKKKQKQNLEKGETGAVVELGGGFYFVH